MLAWALLRSVVVLGGALPAYYRLMEGVRDPTPAPYKNKINIYIYIYIYISCSLGQQGGCIDTDGHGMGCVLIHVPIDIGANKGSSWSTLAPSE